MSRSGGWWFRSDTGDDARVSPQCVTLALLTAANPRPREILACSDCLFAPPSTSLLFFFSSFLLSFFFLVASYDATLGQGPKAAPGAVASYDATRPAAAEGPANSSVPKQQRVGARLVILTRHHRRWLDTRRSEPRCAKPGRSRPRPSCEDLKG